MYFVCSRTHTNTNIHTEEWTTYNIKNILFHTLQYLTIVSFVIRIANPAR